jgi:NAD(P)H-hydrate epimerase
MEEQEQIEQIVKLLQETRQEHHRAYAETNGADPEWPSWYAERMSERLNRLLECRLTKSEIAEQLDALEEGHRDQAPDVNWAEYYARALLKWSMRR